jgi:hypothetical protein
MTGPINCRFCRSTVYRADLVTVRTCQLCWQERINVVIQRRGLWGRWVTRRALRTRREIERWQWEV